MNKKILWSVLALVAIAIGAWIVVGGNNQPQTPSENQNLGASGTRFPNGISADTTSPVPGEVRGSTTTITTGYTVLNGADFSGKQTSFTSSAGTSTNWAVPPAYSAATSTILGLYCRSTTSTSTAMNVYVATTTNPLGTTTLTTLMPMIRVPAGAILDFSWMPGNNLSAGILKPSEYIVVRSASGSSWPEWSGTCSLLSLTP